jgi:putative peptidoglycan lipid II flippase
MGTLLATFLAEGSVSWLYYADRLVQFPLGVFAIAISTAALPSLSIQAAKEDLNEFQDTLSYSLRLVFFITLPCVVGLIVLGDPIVRVLFERGAFDIHSTLMTNKALFFYSLGLLAFSGIRVMVSAFYALQDTKTPVKVAIVAVVANLIFSLTFMGPLKHAGLALALSLASSLQFCLLVFFLKRKVAIGQLRPILVSASKSALAAAAMGAGIYCLHSRWLSTHSSGGFWDMTINLGGLILSGIVLYFLVAKVIGCRELTSVRDMLRSVWKGRGKGRQ